jgi:hypothetical protein
MLRVTPTKRNLMSCAFAVAIAIFSAHAASASTLVYTFTGVGSGTIAGTAFTNQSFTISFTENTTSITSPAGGYYQYGGPGNGISVSFTEGANALTLTGVTLEVNANPFIVSGAYEDVYLFNSDFGSSIGIEPDLTLLSYTLATPITTGVVTGALARLSHF